MGEALSWVTKLLNQWLGKPVLALLTLLHIQPCESAMIRFLITLHSKLSSSRSLRFSFCG